ncbi:death-associated inhibitor of apoptosis 2 isoform X1 [Euwallacea fornicatus]|uniref:death-associated inhibitor of apoptosis 2 isoform X1 n=1 Tax=Euwallacea fornicatus TaxID=995702 RepID=UPI00338D4406
MNIEQNRVNTFTEWPADAAVSPQRIAKAGFYSTNQGLEVECFACHSKISSWNYGDQVMARHRSLNPECPFVLNPGTSGNVPSVITPTSPVPSSSSLDYKNEAVRLASYENWPIPHIVSPEDLARAGFYSLKQGDNTKCAYCKGVVRAWEADDIPDVEHKRHFPVCPFVLSTINSRLESSGDRGGGTTSRGNCNESTFKNLNLVSSSMDGNLDELGVQKHNGPKRPDHGTIEARLRTFTSWSPHLIQTPEILAQAGFYYEGMGDQVRCFHCDGGLRHWDPDDDPWTEHARWFPRCSFVNLVKGQDFVAACSLDHMNVHNVQIEKVKPAKKRRPVTDEELRAHLNSETALTALRIGIDVIRLRCAMKEKLEQTGEGYSQPDALVEAALNVQLDEDDDVDPIYQSRIQMIRTASSLLRDLTKTPDSNSIDHASKPNIPRAAVSSGESSPPGAELLHGGGLKKSVSLEEENRILKEARQCKICMDAEVGIVFLPCGHLATCVNCAPNLEDCPVCRSAIKATVRTFLS